MFRLYDKSLVCLSIGLALLGCQLITLGPPPPDITHIHLFADQIRRGQTARLTLSESQASAWLTRQLAAYAEQTGEPVPFERVQIHFHNNHIVLDSTHRTGPVPASFRVTLSLHTTPQGAPDITIAAIQAGPVSFVGDSLAGIEQTVSRSLDTLWSSLNQRYRLETLKASNGRLSIILAPTNN